MNAYLTTAEVAQILGYRPQTIRAWRYRGTGPRYIRLGGPKGRALYDVEELTAWIEKRKANSTSEESVRAAGASR